MLIEGPQFSQSPDSKTFLVCESFYFGPFEES